MNSWNGLPRRCVRFAAKENRDYALVGLFSTANCNNPLVSSPGRSATGMALWRRAGHSCSGQHDRSRAPANSKERYGACNNRQWWKMCAIFALTLLIGRIGSLVLFALLSLLALREYVTLIPTRRQRSSNAGLELLRHYAVAVLPGRNPLVWVLRDHGSGSGVPFHSHADGDDRRHRAFPGARRENPVRNHDLFVLLESRSSIAHPEDSRIRGP